MRPLELVLLLSFLPALTLPFWPPSRIPRWALSLPFAPSVAAFIQMLLESYRWQLLPAYVLSVLVPVSFLPRLELAMAGKPTTRKSSGMVGAIVVLLALLVSVALGTLMPMFQLPAPTGPYAVGTTTRHFADAARGGRALDVQLWYPARASREAHRAPYMQNPDLLSHAMGAPDFAFSHLAKIPTSSLLDVAVAGDPPTWPVLLFSPGVNGVPTQNTLEFEELASHGYVVASLDHHFTFDAYQIDPGALEPTLEAMKKLMATFEQRVLPEHVKDQAFVLDQLAQLHQADPTGLFTGRLDLSRVGTFGHSYGGTTATRFCAMDARCKAVLNLDGPVHGEVARTGLARPLLYVSSLDPQVSDEQLAKARLPPMYRDAKVMELRTVDALFAASTGPKYRLRLAGSGHLDLSDMSLLMPAMKARGFDARRGHRALGAYAVAFFDTYLRGKPSPLLQGPSAEYPEMQWVRSPEVTTPPTPPATAGPPSP